MTLRVYRKLSFAMVPLSPAVINRRLKLGKEDPARVGERRGMAIGVLDRPLQRGGELGDGVFGRVGKGFGGHRFRFGVWALFAS